MSNKNILDLTDTSDLPEELRGDLLINRRKSYEENLIGLFKISNTLNIDRIIVGYYRKYGEHKDRVKITAKLYNMSRATNPQIRSVKGKKGVYKYINKED